jgi:hypothetical protein
MSKKNDYLAIAIMILLFITSITGILSLNFNYAYDFINQYGHTVEMYGYGIYSFDSYFQAPISIGTDICILLVVIPMFLVKYLNYMKMRDVISELKLISVYAVVFYYATSIVFGVTYNQLFLVYVALFSCSLFGMFWHVINISLQQSIGGSRGINIFLSLSGVALIVAWLPDVIPAMVKGTTLSLIGVYTTNITYVLDMGIISVLCFVTLYMVGKKESLGTLILACILKLCMVVGVMMVPQTICQMASGADVPLPALITKSLSFVLLGAFAFYFNHKMYQELADENGEVR